MQEQVEMLPSNMQEAMNLLAKKWASTQPSVIKDSFGRITGFVHGSKSLSKMIEFKKSSTLTNAIISYFYGLPASRLEDEEYKDYKLRLKFQQALIKHRSHIYNYQVSDEEKRQRKVDKIMKRVNRINQEAA